MGILNELGRFMDDEFEEMSKAEILAKIESNNMHDKLEAKTMLTDQISHMKKRLHQKG